MSIAHPFTEADEDLAHVRAQLQANVSSALQLLDQAATHLDTLRAVDAEFASGRDGNDVDAHLDGAIRAGRAAYAVTQMIIEKERP